MLPKLQSGEDLKIDVEFTVAVRTEVVRSLEADLKQALEDLGILDRIKIERVRWRGNPAKIEGFFVFECLGPKSFIDRTL